MLLFAQSGLTTDQLFDNNYNLPDSDELWKWLKFGIPILALGIILLFASSKSKDKSGGNNVGCVGMILIVVGLILMAPLLEWVGYLFSIGQFILIAGIIIAGIAFGVYSFFKK